MNVGGLGVAVSYSTVSVTHLMFAFCGRLQKAYRFPRHCLHSSLAVFYMLVDSRARFTITRCYNLTFKIILKPNKKDAILAYFFCGGPSKGQMAVAGYDFQGDPLAMYCPVWFLAISLIFRNLKVRLKRFRT